MTNSRTVFWCCIVFAATMCLESMWEIHSFPPKPASSKAPQGVHDTPEYKAGFHDGVLSGGRIMADFLAWKIFWGGDGKPHRLAAGALLDYAKEQFEPNETEGDLVEMYNMRTHELNQVLTKFKCWQKYDPKNKP